MHNNTYIKYVNTLEANNRPNFWKHAPQLLFRRFKCNIGHWTEREFTAWWHGSQLWTSSSPKIDLIALSLVGSSPWCGPMRENGPPGPGGWPRWAI